MDAQCKRRTSILIAGSGTVVEWFDYSLFFYLATALSQTFYPNMESSLLIVLATGAVGFLFRPLGAVVFGHIGDTAGRAVALVASATLMAVAMAGIALMPGYDQIGIWGGIGVLALCALAGFSVGAEYTGIMVYLMETSTPRRRGFTASWAAANSEIGALLAVGSAAFTTMVVGLEGLNEWGWRIPFASGALMAALMIPARRYMVESPAIDEGERAESNDKPLHIAMKYQRRGMLVSFLLSTVGSATYFLTITYLPTYIETVNDADSQSALNYGVLAALTAVIVSPLVGLASDFIGRRLSFAILLGTVISVVIPGYALLGADSTGVVAAAVIMLAIPAAGWSAIAASAVPEQFTTQGRYSGMAVGYNLAAVIFGGMTPPLVAWLSHITDNPLTPAYYAGIIAILAGIPAIVFMLEGVQKKVRG